MWSDRRDKVSRPCSLGGYLWKMKRKYQVHLPQWNKRWFSIEGKYLRWYRKEDSVDISGEISLSQIKSINRFECGRGVYSEERNLFVRADSMKDMEKWSRAIEMQADYARGGDGTSILSNPTQPTTPKRRIRENHSLLSELDRATKALDYLEKEAHNVGAPDTNSTEPSTAIDINGKNMLLSDQPQPGPQTVSNTSCVYRISSQIFDQRLDECFDVDNDGPVVVRYRASKAAPQHNQPFHIPGNKRLDDNNHGHDKYNGESCKVSNISRKANMRRKARTGWM